MAFNLSDLLPLVNTVSGIYNRNQANKAINKYNVPTAAETQSNALYQAMLDPNSPQMQALTATNKAQNLSNFQQQLTEMQLADRRAGAMGRAPTFFNPERADENMSYLTSRGLPQLNYLAQQQAMGQLKAGAEGISGQIAPQYQRNSIGMQQGISNANYQSTIPQSIIQALSGMGNQGQSQTPMIQSGSSQSYINPNQYTYYPINKYNQYPGGLS